MLFIHDTSTKVLIDTGATHSFISCSFVGNLDFRPKPLVEILTVETPSRGLLEAHCVYKDCKIKTLGIEIFVNLMLLDFVGFNVILGMN